jgi:hypothetical protein
VTTTVSSRPFTSTAMCRLTPFVLVPAIPATAGSGHDVGGHRLRVDDRRGGAPVPPGRHPRTVAQRVEDALPRPAAGPAGEHAYTVAAGGNSTGRCRHAIPPPAMYRMASTIARRQCFSGLPPRPAVLPAQATAVRGSPTVRRSPTTSTPRTHVRAPHRAGTTGMARSAMMALWAPGLGGDLVITDPTRSPNVLGSPRGTRPPIAVRKHSLRTGRKLPIRYVRGIPSSAYMSITAVSVEVDWMEIRGGVAA